MEIGTRSDLDIFVTANTDTSLKSRLFQIGLFAELISTNEFLQFPAFSNDGEFLKVYFVEDLKSLTGGRLDDANNLFTARMLLILESRPIVHEDVYRRHLDDILQHYYRDREGRNPFRPLFLLNDLLRYWRTLCLNYEDSRHDPSRAFRKKNINLKFSRMLTVFGTVLPLIVQPSVDVSQLVALCAKTPLERLAAGLDLLSDSDLNNRWHGIMDTYEQFLLWKEEEDLESFLNGEEQKKIVRKNAERLSVFLHDALTHHRVLAEYRRYLVL